MFVLNEDNSIYITRGDIAFFEVTANDDIGNPYTFKSGDTVRIKVFEKKKCENVVLEKDFLIEEDCNEAQIILTKDDTTFGSIISKPRDYWYEIELNPDDNPQTIIGYNEDGPAIFKLFPEGGYI